MAGKSITRKKVLGAVEGDDGAQLRNVFKSLVQYGVCREKTWPYNGNRQNFANLTSKALDEGHRFVGKWFTYWGIKDLGEENVGPNLIAHIEAALTEGFPVAFGFYGSDKNAPLNGGDTLKEQGLTDKFVYTGWMKDGDETWKHAGLIVGLNRKEERFLILNSWSMKFGDQGYFYMSYRRFKPDHGMFMNAGAKDRIPRVDDFWVLKTKLAKSGTTGSDVTKDTSQNNLIKAKL